MKCQLICVLTTARKKHFSQRVSDMLTKVSDIKAVVKKGVENPRKAFPEIKKLAESNNWKVREVAATALVEISKKKDIEVVLEMMRWAEDEAPNVRRASSEGLRDVARKNPKSVLPIIEKLKTDSNTYVKKSVANVLRNAGRYDSKFVLDVCKKWATANDPNTEWIIKDGLRKLKAMYPKEVNEIFNSLSK